ncbi:MAG: exodeoxyribonuclease VII small subunit [Candidatus Sumerlaeota bacterium]
MSAPKPQIVTEKASPEDEKLESTVERLEAIVEELESGDADLERSITLFQEGRKLGAQAMKKLDALERRVQIVVKAEEDKLHLEDFERDDS